MNRFTIIEASLFAFYERLLREGGDAVRPVLEQLQLFGFNFARVWLMNTSVHHLLPWEWPNFYDDLPVCADLLAEYGIYPDFTLGTQYQTLMPKSDDQCRHVERCMKALVEHPGILSLVNEHDQHDNRVSDEALSIDPPLGAAFLYSRGSNGSDSDTVKPIGQVGEYHIIGSEWQRKVGHNAMELADAHDMPVWTSEAQRSDNDGYNVTHAFDAGAGGALLCAGSCCHTPEGKQAQLLTTSAAWAKAWADGARSVNVDCQAGGYTHRNDLEGGDVIRAYQRGSCVVQIHA